MRRHFILATFCFSIVAALVIGRASAQIVQNPDAGVQTLTQASPPSFQVGNEMDCVYTSLSVVTCTYYAAPTPATGLCLSNVHLCPSGTVTYAPAAVAVMTFQAVATAANAAWHTAQGY
jgi:hypothetical protein